MSIGLTREEYEDERNAFTLTCNALADIMRADRCHQNGGCVDIAYEALREVEWLSGINPKEIET